MKRGWFPKQIVEAMVPNIMAGKSLHPCSRRIARASPLEGQSGEATTPRLIMGIACPNMQRA
jgi:hypothetical protein